MKKTLPLVLGVLVGLYALIEAYIPHHYFRDTTTEFQDWGIILAAAAYVLGGLNLVQVTWPKIRRREADWQYKVVLLASAVIMMLAGIKWHKLGDATPGTTTIASVPDQAPNGAGIELEVPDDVMVAISGVGISPGNEVRGKTIPVPPGKYDVKVSRRSSGYTSYVTTVEVAAGQVATITADPPVEWGKNGRVYLWLYDHLFAPCNATMFALLAFYVTSAAFRAFRARNVEAALLLGAAILMMLGRAPIGRAISDSLPDIAQWILDVPNNAGRRAIMMGAAIGAIATGLRVILGLERSHLGAD